MKMNKICPKCNSTEIITDSGMSKRGDRASIPVTGWTNIFVDVYLCTNCGYLEEYIDMNDQSGLEKLKKGWRKVG